MSGDTRHHTDAPSQSNTTNSESSHALLGNIWSKVQHTAGEIKDGAVHGAQVVSQKVKETANDPEVQAKVRHGAQIAGQMGKDIGHGVANDVQATGRDVRNGNYAGAAEKVAPMVLGGGVGGVVVKEVAPHVLKAGMGQLSPETRQKIEGSTVGHMATQAIGRGEIPTSPSDVARMAVSRAKQEAVHSAVQAGVEKAQSYRHDQPATTAATRPETAKQQVKDAPPNAASPSTQTTASWIQQMQNMAGKTKH